MRWYSIIIMATGLAFLSPQLASAQPGPPPGVVQPAPHGKKAAKKPDPKKKHKKDDDRNHGKAVMPPPPPAPVAKPPAPPMHVAKPPAPPMHVAPPPAPRHNPAVDGMEPGAFNHLLASVDRAPFKNDKVRVIQRAAGTNYFTCRQVRTLMDRLPVDRDRVEIASELRSRIVDPHNISIIHDGFRYDRSRDDFKKRHHH